MDPHFTNNFSPDVNYSIQISGVKDLAGNTMQAASLPFAWHEAKAFDVLINEIIINHQLDDFNPNLWKMNHHHFFSIDYRDYLDEDENQDAYN